MSADAATVGAAPALLGGRKAVTAVALALGTFMQVLDTSIANVSIPTIAGNLGVSVDQGTWVITSFAVANGVSVPLTGWLMQRFGVVRTFVVSVALFTIASLLCGLAWSLPSLIAFRVLQGAVSGPMIPGSQALLINVFGPNKRTTALSIWSITTLVAPIAGPLLGGYISDNYVWPWIFLINVPVGLFCAWMCWTNLKSQETPTRKIPIDRIGLALLFVWVGALQIMLDKGKDLDWFNSPLIVALLIVTVVAFAAWLIWELTEKHPIVDLSLFKSRSFALGTVAMCLGYAVFFGNIVLDAAVAAKQSRIHRNLGRLGIGSQRHHRHPDFHDDGTVDASLRSAHARRQRLRFVRVLVFHALAAHRRLELFRVHGAAAGARSRDGTVLRLDARRRLRRLAGA